MLRPASFCVEATAMNAHQATSVDVSVIMPVGSVDPTLDVALEHLNAQKTSFSWELVIALNTADPNERRQLDELLASNTALDARVVDASDVRSASYARNAGANHARGAKLAFCDGDDQAEPDWLQNLIDALEPGTAVGGHLGEDRLVVVGQENWRPPATPGKLPAFLGADYLVSANMAVWAEDFAGVDGFDRELLRGEDIDFSWKLLERGIELRYEPTAVMHYRHRAGLRSLLQQHYLYGRGMAQVLAQRTPPGHEEGGSMMLKANGQKVEQQSVVQVLRRGAIAAGRVRGLLDNAA